MVFNATFTNIAVILWRSVSFVEETGVSEVVIGTDCTGNCKSNFHAINGLLQLMFMAN